MHHQPPARRPPRAHTASLGLLAAALLVVGCRDRAAAPAPLDPVARLSALMRQGTRPGELTADERAEAERLLERMLPALQGPLVGHRWRIAYVDLPKADFVSVDLMDGDGETAPRAMWFHVFWRGELQPREREAWPLRLGRWPAQGLEGHHLFVRAGGLELRAVADAAEYRDAGRMRALLERFDLDRLARL
jgi:hypothetical protein